MEEHVFQIKVMNNSIRLLIIACLGLLVSACSTTRNAPIPVENRSKSAVIQDAEGSTGLQPGPSDGSAVTSEDSMDSIQETESSPAIVALLEEANQAESEGDTASQIAILERAVRIEAKNAYLWNRLARANMRNGKWQQVLNMARRSNSLAGGNHQLQLDNWNLILQVKEKVNDKQGMLEAKEMIQKLRNLVLKKTG